MSSRVRVDVSEISGRVIYLDGPEVPVVGAKRYAPLKQTRPRGIREPRVYVPKRYPIDFQNATIVFTWAIDANHSENVMYHDVRYEQQYAHPSKIRVTHISEYSRDIAWPLSTNVSKDTTVER